MDTPNGAPLCQRCLTKPATVHFQKVVNGEKSDRYLCEDCAREEGAFHFMLGPQFTVQHVLGGLIGQSFPHRERGRLDDRRCSACGYTYQEFAETGRLGCDQCYRTFHGDLMPLIQRIQGRAEHRGKFPRRGARDLAWRREVEALRERLQDAIQREAFEEAAQIRDQIKQLEERGRSHDASL
ncbi:UvrB/UvrC protein [Sulfobacillus acidophilus TPY]|uniref:UvrB/UvrC protein n=1 Tax=Sulfobacillus acidophilus (strain ATCC 700253 / DSM 10332 / NAL) TaxID=679936 RepID=G8TWW2_SULAD|nr:UvrB/UvrC protein [Sulfobacillus acidophilus TPY]AEW03810.1 UvrB/UvrC protein [Sulfobacillus acidophilus DSM 10332]